MIREDVIAELHMMQLKYVNDDGSSKFDDAENEAIYAAIEALEQPEIVHCKDCKFNRNEGGTTDCDFHNFWCAYDDGYCNFGQRKEKNETT